MDCSRCLESLSGYLEGDLPPRIRDLVSSHLGGCPNCSARFRQVSLLTEELKATQRAELPPHFLSRLNEILDRNRGAFVRRRLVARLVFALASLLVILSIVAFRLRRPAPEMASREPGTPDQTLYLSPSERGAGDQVFTITGRSLASDSVFYLLPSSPPRVRTTLTSY